jgi:hypothetical protein
MYQPIRTLARTLLVPASLAAVAFAGQSAASASTLAHFQAPVGSAVAAVPAAHYAAHFAAHYAARPQVRQSHGNWY